MSNNIEHLIREPVPAANETTPMSLLDIGGTLPMTLARQNVVIYFGGTIVVQTNPTAMSIDAAQVKDRDFRPDEATGVIEASARL